MNTNKDNHDIKQQWIFEDWGCLDYKESWDRQTIIFKEKVNRKLQDGHDKKNNNCIATRPSIKNHLIFVEHPPVFTLGKSGDPAHLLLTETMLKQQGFDYYHINRGGDITYHGPGQLVVYPIFDLEQFRCDIHWYLRTLEQISIDLCHHYGIVAERINKLTGVWIKGQKVKNIGASQWDQDEVLSRKICAFGVKMSRWVSMHGLAFNVNTDLTHFRHIIPCGINDKAVTSLQEELGHPIDINEVKVLMKCLFTQYFTDTHLKSV